MSTRCNFAKNCIVNAVVLSSKTFAVPITLQPYECVCLSYQLRLARDGDGFTAKDCLVSYSLEVLNIEIGTSIQINRVHLVGTKIRSFNSKFWKHQVIEFEVNYSSTQSKPVMFSTRGWEVRRWYACCLSRPRLTLCWLSRTFHLTHTNA